MTQPAAMGVPPAQYRRDTWLVGVLATACVAVSLWVCARQGWIMLDRDAMSHIGIARLMVDHRFWTLQFLGPDWLPLPQLLMVPFVMKASWWQSGLGGAIPSAVCFVLTVVGMYRLAARMMPCDWAWVAAALVGLNANLLYLCSTPMSDPVAIVLQVWVVLAACELVASIEAEDVRGCRGQLWWLGGLVFLGTLGRYEGWVLGAGVWMMASWMLTRRRRLLARVAGPYMAFTLLTGLGPALWFAYNVVAWGDWLNFLRGPWAVKRQVQRFFPPGTKQYFGWHSPWDALRLFLRTAQLTAAARETGYALTLAAAWGTWLAWRGRVERTALWLWMPLVFYVYEISSGSLAMEIPQLGTFHTYMTVRYGAELLPALALYTPFALSRLAEWLRARDRTVAARSLQPLALTLVVLSLAVMLIDKPLILQDGLYHALPRMLEQRPLVRDLRTAKTGAPVMIDVWTTQVGMAAVQMAGLTLKQTIGPSDGAAWKTAMNAPAANAGLVVASDGDPITKAVKAHPEGLTLVELLCAPGLPCVRVYRSNRYGQDGETGRAGAL
jgi:hypothetical protein